MKKALSVALLSSLALADLTSSIQTVDILLQKANAIGYATRQHNANFEKFLKRVDVYEKKFNQFVNNIKLEGATAEQIEEFLNKSIKLAKKTESLTEVITNLTKKTKTTSGNYIHTLDTLLATTLRLSDDIGVMADRIGEMADRIVHTEHLIINMSVNILNFGLLIDSTIKTIAEAGLNAFAVSLDQEAPKLESSNKNLDIISQNVQLILKQQHEYDLAVLENQLKLREKTLSALDYIKYEY